jgi:uncharacterized phage protein (TIGR02220 family)
LARPIKDGMDYFPHDTDASSDEKVEALMMLYGTKGYTFYFILLERIYRAPEFELNISDAETIQILSRKMTITTEEFHQILNSAIKHKCFDRERYEKDSVLTSNGIKKRAGIVVEKREKMRVKYGSKKEIISDAETTQETQEETPQSKVKESKVKDSKEDIHIPFQDIINYLNSKTKSNYKPTTNKTKDCIKMRWNEGFKIDDFKKVIDIKTAEWLNTDMSKFLRPETLFGTKFEGYLNQKPGQAKPQQKPLSNFEGRQYDANALEAQLLARSKNDGL